MPPRELVGMSYQVDRLLQEARLMEASPRPTMTIQALREAAAKINEQEAEIAALKQQLYTAQYFKE